MTPTEAALALLPHLARSGITVENIHLLDTTVAVYNFEVSDFHTYFVGNQSIWVHNANCGPKLNNAIAGTTYLIKGSLPLNWSSKNTLLSHVNWSGPVETDT